MITTDQLLCHAIGDYILQSDWMANNKTKRSIAALCHVLTYAIPFLFLRPSALSMAVIIGTHFVIDRWRLARFVVWAKNFLAPVTILHVNDRESAREYISLVGSKNAFFWIGSYAFVAVQNQHWVECRATGYAPDAPAWLAVWLLIIADNILHILINGLALKFL